MNKNYIENKKMELSRYESVIIIDPKIKEKGINDVINEYKNYFEELSNGIVEVENLGIKRLAYEVKGNKEGAYAIHRFNATKDELVNIERKFRLDDNIMKFITVRTELEVDIPETYYRQDNEKEEIAKKDITLKQKVQEKLTKEYNDFIKELKNERPQVILERAYEKVCKEEILYSFEKKDLSIKEYKALLKCKNILSVSYDNWLKCDCNFNDNFDYSIDETILNIKNDYNRNQKKKNLENR